MVTRERTRCRRPVSCMNDGVQEFGGEERTRIVDEQRLVALDVADVRMAGNRPERVEAVRRQVAYRRVIAQPGELRVHPVLVPPVRRIDDGGIQFRRFGDNL